MSKVRVYELARELKIESKTLVNRLKKMGIEVASHQSTLSADQIIRIKREMQGDGSGSDSAPRVIRRRRGADASSGTDSLQSDEDQDSPVEEVSRPVTVIRKKKSTKESPQAVEVESQSSQVEFERGDHQSHSEEESTEVALEPTSTDDVQRFEVEPPAKESPQELSQDSEEAEKSVSQAEPLAHSKIENKASSSNMVASSAKEKAEKSIAKDAEINEEQRVKREGATAARAEETSEQVNKRRLATDSGRYPNKEGESRNSGVSKGGATIVRRASPEEVQARRDARYPRDQRDRDPRGPRGPRESGEANRVVRDRGDSPVNRDRPPPRRDWKGPRPGGDAPPPPRRHDERPVQPADTPLIPIDDPLATGPWKEGTRVKDKEKDKKRLFATVEEENVNKRAVQKQRRDQFNMRTILNQIDETETEEEVEVEEDVVKPVKRRTVYTPQASGKKRDLKRRKDLKKTQITVPKASLRVVKMGHEITVSELAKQLSVKAGEIIKRLMTQGIMATINQNIDHDTATIIASEYDYEVKSNLVSLDDIMVERKKAYQAAELFERPPIVTIMGHVDHGKTSILDAIRKAKVANSEAGGITQHIGAYTVDKNGKKIAFLDTPGHEAFSSMRARGTKVTDIVVLVVAADDGVMPQTIEAISHAKAANVPLIVAINKMDKPNINLDRIYNELTEYGIQAEEWGGDVQFVKVSALQGTGLEDLLDAILLQAEILELKSPVGVPGFGVVVEAHLDKGRGPVATVMIQQGRLKIGDQLVAGTSIGRVRAMHDHLGHRLQEAGPSTPVEVIGLSDVPMAGDPVDVVEDEKTAKEAADWRRKNEERKAVGRSSAASLDELLNRVKEADTPEVPIIIKGDTQGSVEAIAESVMKLNTDRVRNRIVHKAVGGVNESDLSLAETSNSVVIAFNVRAARGLDDMAEKKGIPIRYFGVIYDIVDVLKAVMAGKLPPVQKEVIQGHAEVRQTIRVPKIGTVAGTAVIDGKITRNSQLRLIRDDVVIFSGKIGSLRRFKDDVKEVMQGYECGIGIEGYNDIREGDVIETFIIEEHAPAL